MNTVKSLLLVSLFALGACNQSSKQDTALTLFNNYHTAIKKNGDKWLYTTDTVKQWFDEKSGKPILQIKGAPSSGKWKQWDQEMHSTSYFDSLWFDADENAVKGHFYENNDFYDLIGKGPTKTLCTYWLNTDNKIYEILIYWIPEVNTTTGEHLKPIQEWAMKNDSLEIQTLYPNGRIVPSGENAKRWRILIEKYKAAAGSN